MMVPAQVEDALLRVKLHDTMRRSMRVLHVLATSGGGIIMLAVCSKIGKFPMRGGIPSAAILREHGCH